ncbi:MAG TPA: signal peptidase I [Candidatus Nanoarchaeia archaeon]|nr:signal peptidase I [Candidatus Nanoarchaeia archaeon]
MEYRNLVLYALLFVLGGLSISLIYEIGNVSNQYPSDVIKSPVDSITESFTAVAEGRGIERNSPADHISEDQIKVYGDKVELDIQNAVWSRFANTNSMDPFLDDGSNGIEITPQSAEEIHIGDIISYQSTRSDGIIIHRVIKIDADENGTYFTVKGDNNSLQDPERVRFNQIKGILVGIIY